MINLQECTILIMNTHGQIPKDHIDLKDSWPAMANSLCEMHLEGIMRVVFMKISIQSKMVT